MDADAHREELAKVTEQRDIALQDVEVKRSELEKMKLQVGKNLEFFLTTVHKKIDLFCIQLVNHLMMQQDNYDVRNTEQNSQPPGTKPLCSRWRQKRLFTKFPGRAREVLQK